MTQIRINEDHLQHQLNLLARMEVELAQKESRFEKTELEINKEMMAEIARNTRATIENRKLALASHSKTAQMAIISYHLNNKIFALLDHLKELPGIENNTIYKHRIRRGIIMSKALYWFGKNESDYYKRWNNTHPIKLGQELQKEENITLNEISHEMNETQDTFQIINELEELENATLIPVEILDITVSWQDITMEFVDVNGTGGIAKVLNKVLDFGGKVVDDIAGVATDIIDKGADVIEHTEDTVANFFGAPIKMIIGIVGGIIGLIILLVVGSCTYRYVKTGKTPSPMKAVEFAAKAATTNPINVAGEIARSTFLDSTK